MFKQLLVTSALCLIAIPVLAGDEVLPKEVFLVGGDISMLPRFEELGVDYQGSPKPGDAIAIMVAHGCNCFRLRLFVNPTMNNAVIQDLPYAVALARRIKQASAVLLLDLHYSDTWADPAHQTMPAAWQNLDFLALEAEVEQYTAEVVRTLKEAECLPEIIQVGNEITAGFLWPAGEISDGDPGWKRFSILLKAAVRGVKQPLGPEDSVQVMMHISSSGNADTTAWFLRNLEKYAVDYDLIGLSYYPWWHGTIEDLRRNLKQTAEEFGKDIMVVETAYPWRQDVENRDMNWAQSPEGQRQFLADVIQSVRATPDGRGKGVLWWYPEAVPVAGLSVWKGGSMALFDGQGKAVPALGAFAQPDR